nr:hypothetical protein [uncultured Tolumonas sp.]
MNLFLVLLSNIPFIKQQCVVYLAQNEIKVTNLKTDKSITEVRSNSHPRTLISDPIAYQNQLSQIFKKLFPGFSIFSEIIVCLNGLNEGDYTALEQRSLVEFTKSAGIVRSVFLTTFDVMPETARKLFRGEKMDGLIQ